MVLVKASLKHAGDFEPGTGLHSLFKNQAERVMASLKPILELLEAYKEGVKRNKRAKGGKNAEKRS